MSKAVPFGRYLLLNPIKDGGMSGIWRARPQGEASVVAVKRVLPAFAEDPEMLALFLDEARVSVQLTHPNIARVFDLGRVGEALYLAMEYVPGVDLRTLFRHEASRKARMPLPLAVFVLAKIADALDYAHRRTDAKGRPLRIVHRDVAPDNCLVTFDGEVKLIDFGVAKAESQSQKTEAGALKGKLSYMSPEQVIGKDLDRRSDVFSLGIVLWEMATGERLFFRENQLEILRLVRTAQVPPPSELNPEVPPELDAVILKALSREREGRFAWASELAARLRACLSAMESPPAAAHLRKYLSLAFPKELAAERQRRTEWQRYERETAAPTMMDLKAIKLPPLKPRASPPIPPPPPPVKALRAGDDLRVGRARRRRAADPAAAEHSHRDGAARRAARPGGRAAAAHPFAARGDPRAAVLRREGQRRRRAAHAGDGGVPGRGRGGPGCRAHADDGGLRGAGRGLQCRAAADPGDGRVRRAGDGEARFAAQADRSPALPGRTGRRHGAVARAAPASPCAAGGDGAAGVDAQEAGEALTGSEPRSRRSRGA
ncbi:MAG: serine/threonine-protein kinase [Myxococcales bacterium]